jgi:hypothetical protein
MEQHPQVVTEVQVLHRPFQAPLFFILEGVVELLLTTQFQPPQVVQV